MVVARELALRHWRVILLERSKRLGGKAGSDIKNGRLVEHGYHVFPKWYPNVRAIIDRIGVRLIDFDRYHFLLPGDVSAQDHRARAFEPGCDMAQHLSRTSAVVPQHPVYLLRAGYDQPAAV